MRSLAKIFTLLTVVFLTGCVATGANSDRMAVTNPSISTQKSVKSKFHKKISIGEVTGGSKTNPLWTSQVDNKDLKVALQKSLAVFSYVPVDNNPEYRLDTELVRLEQPLVGINFLVKSRIKYRIVDLKTDETVFYQAIDSQYTAKFTDSLYGVKRLRLASEGSIKNNITALINYLDEEQA